MPPIMARKSKLILAPLNTGKESFSSRLSRIKKSKGFTQVELAEKLGIIQVLISDYERDNLRLHHDMVSRFTQALDVSADESLGIKPSKTKDDQPSMRIAQQLEKIEGLAPAQQKTLLKTIDTFIKAAQI
jgi:transcriptional regulator with XRE-family HTH domain